MLLHVVDVNVRFCTNKRNNNNNNNNWCHTQCKKHHKTLNTVNIEPTIADANDKLLNTSLQPSRDYSYFGIIHTMGEQLFD